MKLLVLGADGMLGHALVAGLGREHDVAATVRLPRAAYAGVAAALPRALHDGVDVRDFGAVERVLDAVRPEVVINAIGIVKQRAESADAIDSLQVNALLPHRLALASAARGARLLHFSTDCVFSGRDGRYRETDRADADDLYGRSKRLGEVDGPGCLTLRTSIIGLELTRRSSLVEWFLAQPGPVRGYRRAIYSGLTTLAMGRVVARVLAPQAWRDGVYHVASAPIDKFTLLCRLRDRLGLPKQIEPDDAFHCDRSLVADRFREDFGFTAPDWDTMIDELAQQIEERDR